MRVPGDPICGQPLLRLEARQRRGGRGREPTVDGRRAEAERDQLELERRDIPADGADRELALAEQGRPSGPSADRVVALDAPGDRDALLPLETASDPSTVSGPWTPSTAAG